MLQGFKNAVADRFNLKKWLGFDHLRDNAKFIGGTYKDLTKKRNFRQGMANPNISFEEMMQLNCLSEADIKKSIRSYRLGSIAFTLVGIAPIAYAGYLLRLDIVLGALVAFLAGCLCFSYAYLYRVALYQFENRVLKVAPKQVLKKWFHLG